MLQLIVKQLKYKGNGKYLEKDKKIYKNNKQ